MISVRDLKISVAIFTAGMATGVYLVFGQGAMIGSHLELVGARLGAAASPVYVDTRFDGGDVSAELRPVLVEEPASRPARKGRR